MPRGTRRGDTSQLGTPVHCGAPRATTPQRSQPRCTVCSGSRTRPSRARCPRSRPGRPGGAPGGPPRRRLGGRPARSSCVEPCHLCRPGGAALQARSSPHPGPGSHRRSRASGPRSGRGFHREGGSRGETSAGDSAARDGRPQTAPTIASNLCASHPARTEAPAAGPSSASVALASEGLAVRRSFPRRNLTLRTPG